MASLGSAVAGPSPGKEELLTTMEDLLFNNVLPEILSEDVIKGILCLYIVFNAEKII